MYPERRTRLNWTTGSILLTLLCLGLVFILHRAFLDASVVVTLLIVLLSSQSYRLLFMSDFL